MDTTTLINFVSATGVIVSVFYLSKQVKIANKSHQDNHEWNRRIETKHALDSYNRLEAVMQLNDAFDFTSVRHAIKRDVILDKFKAIPQLKIHLTRLLNYYEGLANGVDMGLYEEVIIKEARRGGMIRTYNAFSDYIKYDRAEHNPMAFVKYEALVKKWEKEGQQGVKLYKLGVNTTVS